MYLPFGDLDWVWSPERRLFAPFIPGLKRTLQRTSGPVGTTGSSRVSFLVSGLFRRTYLSHGIPDFMSDYVWPELTY